tara:strand:+ start:646 stop:756 length:111 start_codon:yes stop_codon:yes gene_type:complete
MDFKKIDIVVMDIAPSAIMYGVAGAAMGRALDRFKS